MLEGLQLSVLFWDVGKWVGLIGLVCLAFLIFSGDTARYFDRYFGLDRIIKFQRKFSLITAVFLVLHPVLFMLSTNSVMGFIIPDFSVIPLALGIVAFYIFVVIMTASQIAKRIPYSGWQYLHILTYVLFFFGLYHAAYWGSDANLVYIKILYGFLLVAVVGGAVYRTQYKIRKHFAGKFHVKEIKHETKDTFTLVLTPEKKFKFKAGQFCFLRINKNKIYARHPLTISSSPKNHDLHFTIKKAGRFTETASELKKGEEIIVDGPFGNFVERKDTKDLVFIAGGVGITPFMSLIRSQLDKKKARNITLIYGSRTDDDIIFKEELDNISEDWFKKIYVLSQEKSSKIVCEKGYITKSTIEKHLDNISNVLFYICGPEAMKECVKEALIDLGVKKRDIIIEDFFW